MIAALYVQKGGCYYGLPNVDPWDEERDARLYAGPHPVIAHPPCNLWVNMAAVNWKRYGRQKPAWYSGGTDGGCFKAALKSLYKFGGVLEHPAFSHAWDVYPVIKPDGIGWTRDPLLPNVYVCEVWQSVYGHRARKRTWVLYCGKKPPPELNWERKPGVSQIGWCNHIRPTKKPSLSKKESQSTPIEFRDLLLRIARSARREDR